MTNASALLTAKYPNRRALLGCTTRDGDKTSLYVPIEQPMEPGSEVRLKVTFADGNRNYYVGGRVGGLRTVAGKPAMWQLLVESARERRAFSHLLAFCAQNQEAARRIPTAILCGVRVADARVLGKICDLSMTGAFICARQKGLLPGAPIELELKSGLFGLSSSLLQAEVSWQGEKQGVTGVGVHFTCGPQPVLNLMRQHGPKTG